MFFFRDAPNEFVGAKVEFGFVDVEFPSLEDIRKAGADQKRMQVLGRNDLCVLAKVKEREEGFPIVGSYDPEDMGVAKIDGDLAGLSMEIRQDFPLFDQLLQLLEYPIFEGTDVVALLRPLPVEEGSMDPPAFRRLRRIQKIALIIQRRDFIARIDQRDAAIRKDEGMGEMDTANRFFLPVEFFLLQRFLQAQQTRQGAVGPRIHGRRVELVMLAHGERPWIIPTVKMDQELLVVVGIPSELADRVFVEPPSDVVVAARIVHPRRTVREMEAVGIDRQQAGVARREGMVDVHHQVGVIHDLAFGFRIRPEVLDDFLRFDDRFAKQGDRWANLLFDQMIKAHQVMDDRQIPARRIDLFPHERDRI